MAFFDESQDNVVIRIVYVGPPFSGKTESLRALSRVLTGKSNGNATYSPSDAYGRTLYFDWFDHCAGLFRGRPIRCQIIAVPGQTTLTDRRKLLVDMADCVVFVADATPDRWGKNREFLDEIVPWVKQPQPPIGIVFQLNKQDCPGAYSDGEFRKILAEVDYPNPVVRLSSATTGDGLREAFIMAVSFALDRVHALIDSDKLPKGKILDVKNGQHLFDLMSQREHSATKAQGAFALDSGANGSTVLSPPLQKAETQPSMEDKQDPSSTLDGSGKEHAPGARAVTSSLSSVAVSSDSSLVLRSLKTHVVAGGIYLPVHGRERMYAAVAGLRAPELQADGSWLAASSEWRVRSTHAERFTGLAPARQHLLSLAQTCESLKHVLDKERFVAVTELEDGRYLVWQGVKISHSAEEWLQSGALQPNALRCATMLSVTAKRLRTTLSRLTSGHERLVLGLDNMIMRDEELLYSGFLVESGTSVDQSKPPMKRFSEILEHHLRTWPQTRRLEVRDLWKGGVGAGAGSDKELAAALEEVGRLLNQIVVPVAEAA